MLDTQCLICINAFRIFTTFPTSTIQHPQSEHFYRVPRTIYSVVYLKIIILQNVNCAYMKKLSIYYIICTVCFLCDIQYTIGRKWIGCSMFGHYCYYFTIISCSKRVFISRFRCSLLFERKNIGLYNTIYFFIGHCFAHTFALFLWNIDVYTYNKYYKVSLGKKKSPILAKGQNELFIKWNHRIVRLP